MAPCPRCWHSIPKFALR
ncbi:zinc finger domain-containing protein [Pseudomonas cichorii]